MNVNEMTFGIEIECTLPRAAFAQHGIRIGGRHHGVELPSPLFPPGWNAQSDGSITPGRGHCGVEVVSPVLKGVDGLRQIVAVAATLRRLGAKVNPTCGFHCHVGYRVEEVEKLQSLVFLASNLERAVYAASGTKGRENGGYCKSVRNSFEGVNWDAIKAAEAERGNARAAVNAAPAYCLRDRYHLLNLENLLSGRKPTVEFRAFGGTLNGAKMISYVRMCLAVVQKSLVMKRRAAWVEKPIRRGDRPARPKPATTGLQEVQRFFLQVGWTKGRTDVVFGDLTGDGLPGLDASKRVLVELARKYDGDPRVGGFDENALPPH